MNRFGLALGLLTLATACSSSSGGASPTGTSDSGTPADSEMTADGATDDAGLSADEQTTFTMGGHSLAFSQEATTLADSLFDFDPTINPSATPSANATSIGQNIQANLGTCGTVTVSGATVSVNFGSPPGCTLKTGAVVSGSVSLSVSKSGGTTSVALTTPGVVVNGEPLDGTASFATSNGSTFTVTLDLTSGTKSDNSSLTVDGSQGSLTISGSATIVEAGITSSVTFTNVNHVEGECYATAGSMTVKTGILTETLTFLSTTPMTGLVDVATGKKATTTTLPAYGDCPSDAHDGG